MSNVEVEVQTPGDALFNQSFDIIKDAMKTVKQEVVITLLDGTPHIAYIHDAKFEGDRVVVDFSTLSEDRKEEIGIQVERCIQAQLNELMKEAKRRFSF